MFSCVAFIDANDDASTVALNFRHQFFASLPGCMFISPLQTEVLDFLTLLELVFYAQ